MVFYAGLKWRLTETNHLFFKSSAFLVYLACCHAGAQRQKKKFASTLMQQAYARKASGPAWRVRHSHNFSRLAAIRVMAEQMGVLWFWSQWLRTMAGPESAANQAQRACKLENKRPISGAAIFANGLIGGRLDAGSLSFSLCVRVCVWVCACRRASMTSCGDLK